MDGLVKRIKTYAFTHNCDLDKATYMVCVEIVNECKMARSLEGLFDRLSGAVKEEETT